MKKIISCFCIIMITSIFIINDSKSQTHFAGGEVTWECTPQGNFRFIAKIYRDCSGITLPQSISLETNVPGFSTITLNQVSDTEITLQCGCSGGTPVSCSTTLSGQPEGSVIELVYTSDSSFANGVPLTGVPPPSGWYFGVKGNHRSIVSDNIENSQAALGYFLRAWMFPYNNTPVNTCFDNSPEFLERPAFAFCTGPYSHIMSSLASDAEHDSLTFNWCVPLFDNIDDTITPLLYNTGYSYDSPLPGPTIDMNSIAALLDPQTGEISFTSFTNGAFTYVVKVTAYKRGVKVAEIFREVHLLLLSCTPNSPPNFSPPFPNSQGQYVNFIDTVYAGQHVSFSISATNFEDCPGTAPPVPQTLSLYAVGAQFGAPINLAGCLIPPCADLTPAPTAALPHTGFFGVQTKFSWQTTCDHLIMNDTGNVYPYRHNFLVNVYDNFCPTPGFRQKTISVVVVEKTEIEPQEINCLKVLPNGDVEINWNKILDTLDLFHSYYIWYSNDLHGNYSIIDSIDDKNLTATVHSGANAMNMPGYYYITVRGGCLGNILSEPGNVASTIQLKVEYVEDTVVQALLSWKPTHVPLLNSSEGIYQVWRKYPGSTWTLIGATAGTEWIDTISLANLIAEYYVSINDTAKDAGCVSKSNVAEISFLNNDVGVSNIRYPYLNTASGVYMPVEIVIRNYGVNTHTSFPVSYSIDGVTIVTDQWNGLLKPFDSVLYTFSQPFLVPQSQYQICAKTLLPADTVNANDTFCRYYNIINTSEQLSKRFTLGDNIPNPAGNLAVIPFTIPLPGEVVFKLTAINGKHLMESNYQAEKGENHININTENLPSGIYLYSLEYNGMIRTKKMIISK